MNASRTTSRTMGRLAFLFFALTSVALASGGGEGGEHHVSGFPGKEIGFHTLNFAILLGLFFYFGRRPIRDALQKRAAEIRHTLAEVNAERKAAQERHAEIVAKLESFDKHLDEMKAEAEEDGKREAEAIVAKGQAMAEQVAAIAERSIRDETARARATLRRDAVHLAVSIAEERVKSDIKAGDQKRFHESFLSTLKTNGADHG